MPPKRSLTGPSSTPPAKALKTEPKPEDFSNSVKKRLQSSTRTGQACDRCKIRKIRCDGLPGGCSPCLQINTECRTTDRITGRAAPRGYVDNIETQNREQANRIRELESLLIQNGVEFKPHVPFPTPAESYSAYQMVERNSQTNHGWTPNGTSPTFPTSSNVLGQSTSESNLFKALPTFRSGCSGDNYLGVSSGNSHLSAIKGTALSILGMEIDIADFVSYDMDEPDRSSPHGALYNKSYQAFLQTSLNINPKLEKVKLPERDEGINYAQWYLRVINPFAPVLHRKSFMDLVTQMYDDPSFRPSVAQTVMVHMVFAMMFFQFAVRNIDNAEQQSYFNNQSNMHYHYALSMFYQLSCSHTFSDVQAMTMICMHLRNFPKPGASWIFSTTTMSVAIELGLHRSTRQWHSENHPNVLETEMRKRTFWTLLTIHLTVAGKLGRPMALRIEDFDIELPDPIDDDLISEHGIDTSRQVPCAHHIGIMGYKIVPLFLEMYTTIYAVRRSPETYIDTVKRLERRLNEWIKSVPDELSLNKSNSNEQEGRVFAVYLAAWALEFKMLLRHPSVSLTQDPKFNAESMQVCVGAAREMLGHVKQMRAYKSLDTTWYNSAVYVMAITTTLFAQWEKRNETTAADLADLRREMGDWLDIMGDVGILLGSGSRLREAVRVVTDGTLSLLSRNLNENPSANAALLATPNSQEMNAKLSRQGSIPQSNGANGLSTQKYRQYSDANIASGPAHNSTGSGTFTAAENHPNHQQTPYPAATQYSNYSDTSNGSYNQQEGHNYNSYNAAPNDSVEAPLLAAFAAQASQVATNNWQNNPADHDFPHPGSQAWQDWTVKMATATMAGNLEAQDCYSASALMLLGGRDLGVSNAGQMADMANPQATVMQQDPNPMHGATVGHGSVSWPMNIFDMSQA